MQTAEQTAIECSYRFVIEYSRENGDGLASLPLDPDFGPARECCQLSGVGAGVLAPTATLPTARIEPVWSDEAGAPQLSALRVSMDADRGDGPVAVVLDASPYFRAAVRRGATRLVEQGVLATGDYFRHRLLAWPFEQATQEATRRESALRRASGAAAHDAPLLDFDIDFDGEAVPIVERSLAALVGSTAICADELCPVVVHDEVVCDLLALAEQAGDNECGAGLLGYLARDSRSGRLWVEVTALAPVRGGVSAERSFIFTDESWASVHDIAAVRGLGELLVGYAHSHPSFCRACPAERQLHCSLARPFFSSDDVHLQRTVFPKAWQVALLASDLPREGRVVNLFGWKSGVIVDRPFATTPPLEAGMPTTTDVAAGSAHTTQEERA